MEGLFLAGGPLQGIKVLDVSQVAAAPFAAAMLGEMGADVIKIESPSGDIFRSNGYAFINGTSAAFFSVNRNKRGIVVDLKTEKGKSLVQRMAEQIDIFIENFRPGVADRLGIGYDELKQRNPRLIYASVAGFRAESNYGNKQATDFLIQAMSGIMSITGEPDRPPMKVGEVIVDMYTAMALSQAILLALYNRERTGLGEHITISLLDAAMTLQTINLTQFLNSGRHVQRDGNASSLGTPVGAFRGSDGKHFVMAAAFPGMWESLCSLLGREDLLADTRFQTIADRMRHREELDAILQAEFAKKPAHEWIQLLEESNILCAPVYDHQDLLNDQGTLASEMVRVVSHDKLGDVKLIGLPYRFRNTRIAPHRPAPLLGEHTDAVLKDFGLSDQEIGQLREEGVIR